MKVDDGFLGGQGNALWTTNPTEVLGTDWSDPPL